MSKYEALQKGFAAAKQADQDYWESLRQLIRQTRIGFCQYLGVSPEALVKLSDGRDVAVVAIGKMDGSEFRYVAFDKLDKSNQTVHFSMQVILDPVAYQAPKNTVVFNMSIYKDEDGFHLIEQSDFDKVSFLCPPMTELYDHLHAALVSEISRKA